MSGKYTEYGMSYQKRVLMYYFICFSNSYNSFYYEGGDDVVCINTNDNRTLYIQAKTGNLTFDDKKTIFYNWIRLKPSNNCLFEIYSVKNFEFDLKRIKKEILETLDTASSLADSNNIKKAYQACFVNGTYSNKKAEEYLDIIIDHFAFNGKITDEKLDKSIFDFYKHNKIHDNKYIDSQIEKHIKSIAGECLLLIDSLIGEAAHTNSTITITASQVDEWIDTAKQLYGAERYNRRQYEFNQEMPNFIADDNRREVLQLKLLGLSDSFIAESLINEIFYKDFRDYYIDANENDINSIENKAHSNYQLKSIGVDLTNKKECIELFKNVYDETIEDPLITSMADAKYCSNGCYIYLTSDEAKSSIQITWTRTNE